MRTGTVYGQYDPETDDLRYVGKTLSKSLDSYLGAVISRIKHQPLRRPPSQQYLWIKDLLSRGLEPIIRPLETDVPEEALHGRERQWIAKALADGCDLLNRNGRGPGGLNLTWPAEMNARRAATMTGSKHVLMTEREKTHGWVYVLVDPRDMSIFYVGKTKHRLARRMYHHLWGSQKDRTHYTATEQRIQEITAAGYEPTIQPLANLPHAQLFAAETLWLKYMREIGCDLTNRKYVPTAGSDGTKRAGAKHRGRKRDPQVTLKVKATIEANGGWMWNTAESRSKAEETKALHRGLSSCVVCHKVCKGTVGILTHLRGKCRGKAWAT